MNDEKTKGQRWIQIFLTPFVVAVVGGVGTYIITKQQTDSAERLAAAELASAERLARAEQQVRILEQFSERILSHEAGERETAVRLLGTIDEELATKIAQAIANDEEEDEKVRTVAEQVLKSLKRGFAFPVVASVKSLDEALTKAKQLLKNRDLPYRPEVYLAENDLYAVTLGGYLKREEAAKRVKYARENKIAWDAYVWQSTVWGQNLFDGGVGARR